MKNSINFGKFRWTLPSNSVPDTWHHWEPLRMLRCHCYWWRSHWPVQWWPDPGPRHDIGTDQFGAKGTNQFCWFNWNCNSGVEVRSCSLIFQEVSKRNSIAVQFIGSWRLPFEAEIYHFMRDGISFRFLNSPTNDPTTQLPNYTTSQP